MCRNWKSTCGKRGTSDYAAPVALLETIFAGARSIVVLDDKELDSCDARISTWDERADFNADGVRRTCNYKLAGHLERRFGADVKTVPASYPMAQNENTKGAVGQACSVTRRQTAGEGRSAAAIPWGSPDAMPISSAVRHRSEIASDPPVGENPCTACGRRPGRPAKAQARGRTDVRQCVRAACRTD